MEFKKFIFGETLEQAIEAIPEEYQLKFFRFIKNYGLHGIEPELTGFELATWVLMRESIDNMARQGGKVAKGHNHWNWKGGITCSNHKIRESAEYKHWIKAVFKRDKYICQECGKKGGKLNAHHIKSFAKYPMLRFLVSNGVTYCEKCHIKWHKENGRGK